MWPPKVDSVVQGSLLVNSSPPCIFISSSHWFSHGSLIPRCPKLQKSPVDAKFYFLSIMTKQTHKCQKFSSQSYTMDLTKSILTSCKVYPAETLHRFAERLKSLGQNIWYMPQRYKWLPNISSQEEKTLSGTVGSLVYTHEQYRKTNKKTKYWTRSCHLSPGHSATPDDI